MTEPRSVGYSANAMYLRLVSTLAAFLLLLVSSGEALLIHERIEHHHIESLTTASSSDGVVAVHDRVTAPAKPLHSHSREDCPTCDQLHHFVAIAAVLLFVFGLFAAAITFRAASIEWPALASVASPRSSRGPPLFA